MVRIWAASLVVALVIAAASLGGAAAGQLGDAVAANDIAKVEALIAAGAKVDEKGFTGTPLHTAAAKGFADMVKVLLDAGANVEAEGMGKARPLHIAARRNEAAIVGLLLAHGAKVDPRDSEGMTPLLIAALSGSVDVALLLLDAGADPTAADTHWHATPLEYAALTGHKAVVTALLGKGLDINAPAGETGQTPLFFMLYRNPANDAPLMLDARLDMIDFLVASGADPNIVRADGKTPYQLAVEPEIRERLVARGAKP
jgi:ankyrin repeat protein